MSKKPKGDYIGDGVDSVKGFVDGYDDEDDCFDDGTHFNPVEYSLCSCCANECLLLGRVYIELNDDHKIEAEDICLDCIVEKINEYMQGEIE